MDKYVTGAVIRKLREDKKMTQEELAEKVFVSSKAVSKWETGQGFPDVSLIEPLAKALGISVIELLSGEDIKNVNRAPFERPRVYIHSGRMFKTYHRRPYLRHHSSHKRTERL